MTAFDKCQAAYDAMLPDDPEEEDEKEARRLARIERQCDDYDERRRGR